LFVNNSDRSGARVFKNVIKSIKTKETREEARDEFSEESKPQKPEGTRRQESWEKQYTTFSISKKRKNVLGEIEKK